MGFRFAFSLTALAVGLGVTLAAQAPASPPVKPAPMVAAAALQQQFPDIAGWTREAVGSDHVAISDGCGYVFVSARYKKDDVSVLLTLADSGAASDSLTSLAPMVVLLPPGYSESIAPATSVKRFELGGQPAASRYDARAREAELTVLIGGRFVAKAEANNVAGLEPLVAILENVNFGKVSALK